MADSPITYTYHIEKTYPHSTDAFTEGLLYDSGFLYESTGTYGMSSLRRVDLLSGSVNQENILSSTYFGEGLAAVNNSLIQLTWRNHIGFIYDKATLTLQRNFSYSSEGWGLTYDGKSLIMSDGSENLTVIDPTTYQIISQVNVHDGTTKIANLNELEYINGDVYANIWQQQTIAIINPQTGQVRGYIDLAGLYQPQGSEDVLNGIAYDQTTNRLFVTGKNWPNLFEITIQPKT
jgi:glutaminyl-peptide cyclotransferase